MPNPTANPTPIPTAYPTPNPTANPTPNPTAYPTPNPSPNPTANPTPNPTPYPTANPTANPTPNPTANPTPNPTANPTAYPTAYPTAAPVSSCSSKYSCRSCQRTTGCYWCRQGWWINMGRCYPNNQVSICLWSSRTCRWRWWWFFTWRYRLRVRKGYSSSFMSDTFVQGALQSAGQSRVSPLGAADAVLIVDLDLQNDRRVASVTEEYEVIQVNYSYYVPSDPDDVRRTAPVSQHEIDSLSADLAQVSAEEYTQDFLTEMSGVSGVAAFGVEPMAGTATDPEVEIQSDLPTPSPTPSPTASPVSE